MKPYKYVGPHDAVNLAGFGEVAQGATVQVPPALETEFDGRDDFEHVTDTKKKG